MDTRSLCIGFLFLLATAFFASTGNGGLPGEPDTGGGDLTGMCAATGDPGAGSGPHPLAGFHAHEAAITTSGLSALVHSGIPMILLDARASKDDDGRRIGKAVRLSADSTDDEILGLLRWKKALIVAYGKDMQSTAAAALARRLRSLGYVNVVEYPWGMEGWVAAGETTYPARR